MEAPDRVGAVVQARTTSCRCPGKVLRTVVDRPLLEWLVERVRLAPVDGVVVATSDEAADDEIEELCRALGVDCHRGPLADVARRLLEAGRGAGFDAIVRLSGDSPLLLPSIVKVAVEHYRKLDIDLVTNTFPRSYPRGQSVEIVRLDVLEDALPRMYEPRHHEHVTPWLYEHDDEVRIHNFGLDCDLSSLSMAVDTEADFIRIRTVLEFLGHPTAGLDLDELLELLGPAQQNGRRSAP